MLSKVKFDLDVENNPVIIAEFAISNDVRDKIANRFREGFAYESNWALVSFGEINSSKSPITITIKPIPPHLLGVNSQLMTQRLESIKSREGSQKTVS